MKMYGGIEVYLHIFLIMALDGENFCPCQEMNPDSPLVQLIS
jgi:hypothetical protein